MGAQGILAVGPPAFPMWFTIIRIAIIVLAFGVLVAAAYHLSLYGGLIAGDSGPAGFLIFDAIFSWIILGVMIGFEFALPKLYFRVAFLAALSLSAIFWLSAWAWGASVTSLFMDYGYTDKLGPSLAAATALGAFAWVLTIVVAVFLVLFSLRDDLGDVSQAELGQVQVQTSEPKAYDQQAPQQQQYQQQAYDQQAPQQQQYQQQAYDQQQQAAQQQYVPQEQHQQQQQYQQAPPQ